MGSWASVCTCSGLRYRGRIPPGWREPGCVRCGAERSSDFLPPPRGLVVLSPERSYTLELGPGDLRAAPIISRTRDLLLPGRTCGLSGHASVATRAPQERPRGRRHSHMRSRRVRMTARGQASVVPEGQAPDPQRSLFPVPSKELLPWVGPCVNIISSPPPETLGGSGWQ